MSKIQSYWDYSKSRG